MQAAKHIQRGSGIPLLFGSEFYDDLNSEVFILLIPVPYVPAHILITRLVLSLLYSKQPILTHKCIYLLFCCYKRIFFPTL